MPCSRMPMLPAGLTAPAPCVCHHQQAADGDSSGTALQLMGTTARNRRVAVSRLISSKPSSVQSSPPPTHPSRSHHALSRLRILYARLVSTHSCTPAHPPHSHLLADPTLAVDPTSRKAAASMPFLTTCLVPTTCWPLTAYQQAPQQYPSHLCPPPSSHAACMLADHSMPAALPAALARSIPFTACQLPTQ